jgi:hypothetical protein
MRQPGGSIQELIQAPLSGGALACQAHRIDRDVDRLATEECLVDVSLCGKPTGRRPPF